MPLIAPSDYRPYAERHEGCVPARPGHGVVNEDARARLNEWRDSFLRSSPQSPRSWRPIKIAPNYEVSSRGHVRRISAGKKTWAGRQLKVFWSMNWRYLSVGLCVDGKMVHITIHRLVATTWLPQAATHLKYIAHLDGDARNNHFSNLIWCTQKTNLSHMKIHGTDNREGGNRNRKLSESDIPKIREMRRSISSIEIAKKFAVSPATIRSVMAGRTWAHVQSEVGACR